MVKHGHKSSEGLEMKHNRKSPVVSVKSLQMWVSFCLVFFFGLPGLIITHCVELGKFS